MKSNQFALNTVSLKGDAPLEEMLDACAAAGFGAVEFCLPHVKGFLAKGRKPADLRKLLDRLGLRSIGGFESCINAFGDAAAQQTEADKLVDNAKLLNELGGGVLVTGSDGPAERKLEATVTLGRKLAEVAERFPSDVRLALECNWSAVAKTTKANILTCQAARHPRVGMLFDPAHYYVQANKLDDFTAEVVGHIFHIHVNNMRDQPGEYCHCNTDRLLPGDPNVAMDLRALFGRLEQHGYHGFFSIEMFSEDLWQLSPAQAAKKMYAAMKTLL